MPIVELDDGTEIEFPDDMSGDEIKAVLDKQYGAQSKPDKSNIPLFERARGSGFLKGYFDPAAGAAQLTEQLSSNRSTLPPEAVLAGLKPESIDEKVRKEEAIYQANREARGEEGIDWSRIGGSLASPVGLAGFNAPLNAATLPARMKAGALTSAAYGSTMPVTEGDDYWGDKRNQVLISGGAGGTLPVATALLKGIGKAGVEFSRPWSQKGIGKDVNNYIRKLAGGQEQKIVDALKRRKVFVYGSEPTSAQAIAGRNMELMKEGVPDVFGSPFVRLEKDLSKSINVGDVIKTRYAQQQAAREGILKGMAGTEDDMARAVAERTKVTAPLMETVRKSKQAVLAKPVADKIDEIIANNPNETSITRPLMQLKAKLIRSAKKDADSLDDIIYGRVDESNIPTIFKQEADDVIVGPSRMPLSSKAERINATEAGVTDEAIDFAASPRALASLSKEIKAMMGKKGPSGQNEYDVAVLKQVKDVLDKEIGVAENAYKLFREQYKQLSAPINKMDVARTMQDKLMPPTGKEASGTYLKALDEAPKTIKQATGFPRYKSLEQAVGPEQARQYKNIASDLERALQAQRMQSATGGVAKTIPGEIEPMLPNMLSRPALIANAILKKIAKDVTPEYEERITKILLDPDELARVLSMPASNPQREAILGALNKVMTISAAQTAGRQQ